MYIPRPLLIFLIIVYVLFLLSVDWMTSGGAAWYRPFVVGLLVIIVAAWVQREEDSDEL